MNICIPVIDDKGLESKLSGHFGSAPLFLIVDTDTKAYRPVPNANQAHAHGMCQPLTSLFGQQIEAAVVGGIGAGALAKLQAAGLKVYQAAGSSVGEACDAFVAGKLAEITPETSCRHHGHGAHQHAGHGHGAHLQGLHGHGPHGAGLGGPHRSGRK